MQARVRAGRLSSKPLGRFTFEANSVIQLTLIIASLVMMLTACIPRRDMDFTELPSNTEAPPTHEFNKQQLPTPTAKAATIEPVTPTYTPEFARTPVPPLTSHEWMPEGILVKIEAVGTGDGCCIYSLPPFLILYADGCSGRKRTSVLENVLGHRMSDTIMVLNSYQERQTVISPYPNNLE